MNDMIFGKSFLNDNNDALQNAQYELYGKLVTILFDFPRERYIQSSNLIRVEQHIIDAIKSIRDIDHRVFQSSHDLIASYFRYSYDKLIEENNEVIFLGLPATDFVSTAYYYEYEHSMKYPELKECQQGDLFKKKEDYSICLKKNWVHFFQKEVLYLTYLETSFTKSALMAGLYQNQDVGYKAEDIMTGILYLRYCCEDWYFNHDNNFRKEITNDFNDIINKYYNGFNWEIEINVPVNFKLTS